MEHETSTLHAEVLINKQKKSSSYLTLGDSAVVKVSTKLDSNQPTMSPLNSLG